MVSAMASRCLSAVGGRPGHMSPTPSTDSRSCQLRHRHRLSVSLASAAGAPRCRWRRRQLLRLATDPGSGVDAGPAPDRWSGVDTPSSRSPRSTGWTDRGVSVGLSGRGVPPATHADAFGRNTRTKSAHNDASKPRTAGGSTLSYASTPLSPQEDHDRGVCHGVHVSAVGGRPGHMSPTPSTDSRSCQLRHRHRLSVSLA